MKLSETLTMKLNKAEDLIEQARMLVLQVIYEDETGTVDLKFDEIVDFISDIGYDVIMAAHRQEEDDVIIAAHRQEEEAERLLAEIHTLKKRLAELGA